MTKAMWNCCSRSQVFRRHRWGEIWIKIHDKSYAGNAIYRFLTFMMTDHDSKNPRWNICFWINSSARQVKRQRVFCGNNQAGTCWGYEVLLVRDWTYDLTTTVNNWCWIYAETDKFLWQFMNSGNHVQCYTPIAQWNWICLSSSTGTWGGVVVSNKEEGIGVIGSIPARSNMFCLMFCPWLV